MKQPTKAELIETVRRYSVDNAVLYEALQVAMNGEAAEAVESAIDPEERSCRWDFTLHRTARAHGGIVIVRDGSGNSPRFEAFHFDEFRLRWQNPGTGYSYAIRDACDRLERKRHELWQQRKAS